MNLKKIPREWVEWNTMHQDKDKWQAVMNLQVP